MMDQENVRQRLLRLNQEMHDPRFTGRDLTAIVGLWNNARTAYQEGKYDTSQGFIDEGYRLLYLAPQSQQQGQQINQQPLQAPQPVFFMYDEPPSESLADNLSHNASEFFLLLFKILTDPTNTFKNINIVKSARDSTVYFALFGIVSSIVLILGFYTVVGKYMNLISGFSSLVVLFMVMPIVCAWIGHKVCRYFGGSASFAYTASVYGLSLAPTIAGLIVTGYIAYATAYLKIADGISISNIVGVAVVLAACFCGLAWSLMLQTIGLSTVHNIGRRKAFLTALLTLSLVVFAMEALLALFGAASMAVL
jgi:hypothetical protein